jgi:hypothetical protein
MPIDFFEANDRLRIRQSFNSPTVYLDHWAIRLFSDNLQLQNRFVDALKIKGGTLLLSPFSFTEFSGPEDRRHCHDTEQFLQRVIPNIFFTDFDINKTLDREAKEANNVKRFWPSADLSSLKYLAETRYNNSGILSMTGWLSMINDNRTKLIKQKTEIVSQIQEAFNNARHDTEYVKKARTIQPSNQRTRTFNILGELMRGFYLDPSSPIKDNDIIDLFHTISPLNCCDFILLDSAWEERVKKMNLRISKTSMVMHIAKCFSKRNDGVSIFLGELEAFDKKSHKETVACP